MPPDFIPEEELKKEVCAGADLNGDMVVNQTDTELLLETYGQKPGPSGFVLLKPNPVDSDSDGVADADDQCISTPPGETVDQTGCSVLESCPCRHPNFVGASGKTMEPTSYVSLTLRNALYPKA